MGTRSTIAIRNEDGTVSGIYCHWDGYLAYNGKILVENYTDEAKVRELIALGNISSLGENIGSKVDFDDYDSHNKGQCVAYGRDRGERDQEAKNYPFWDALIGNAGEEYNYLFVPGEGWYVEYYGRYGKVVDEMAAEAAE